MRAHPVLPAIALALLAFLSSPAFSQASNAQSGPFTLTISYTYPNPFPPSLTGTAVTYTGPSTFGPCQQTVIAGEGSNSNTSTYTFASGSLNLTTTSFTTPVTTGGTFSQGFAGTVTGGSGIFTNATGSWTGTETLPDSTGNTYTDTFSASGTIMLADGQGVVVLPASVQVGAAQGTTPGSATLMLNNEGLTPASYTASAAVTSTPNWLSVSSASGNLTPGAAASLPVTADPTGLALGVYQGQINLNINGSVTPVPVTFVVGPLGGHLLLSQTGLSFSATLGAAAPAAQTLSVLNTGIGTLSGLTATTSVTDAGSNWLQASIASGFASGTQAAVTVTVTPGSLPPGTHYGQINFNLPSAVNSPQTVTVQMVVGAALPTFQPASVNFQVGIDANLALAGSPPSPVQVVIKNPGLTTVHFTATPTPVALGGPLQGSWFQFNPASGVLAPGAQTQLQISFNQICFAGTGNCGIDAPFPAFALLNVNFPELDYSYYLWTVVDLTGGGSATGIPSWGAPPGGATCPGCANAQVSRPSGIRSFAGIRPVTTLSTASTCTPSVLDGTVTSQSLSGFQTTVGQPTPLQLTLFDNCGNNLNSGTVVASFSSGDSPVPLNPLGGGQWSATWVPSSASTNAAISLQGVSVSGLSGSGSLSGTVAASTATPIVNNGGIVNAASGGGVIAPGAFIAIFGENMAGSTTTESSATYPASLGSTQVFLGGEALPLYFTAGMQIDAIVPFDVTPNSSQVLMVQTGDALSTPVPVTVATAAPGVFTQNQSGSGPGAILGVHPGGTPALNTASNPASAGDALEIYCTGLGPVSPSVIAGTPASSTTLSYTENTVTATVGGKNAQVLFAGLAPGYVGLYQVNVTVPAGIPASSAVPLVLSVAGASSAPVTVALQ